MTELNPDDAKFHRVASKIRSEISRYNKWRFLQLLLDYLHMPLNEPLGKAKKMPWVTLLAMQWTIELSGSGGNRTPTRQDVYNVLNRIYGTQSLAMPFSKEHSFRVELRALFIPQVRLQRSPYLHYNHLARSILMLDYHPNGQALKDAFESKLGISLEKFLDIALTVVLCFFSGEVKVMKYEDLTRMMGAKFSAEEIARVVTRIGATPRGFKSLTPDDRNRTIYRSEYVQDTVFFKKPLILRDKAIINTLPAVLIRGVCEFFTRQFLRLNSSYREQFSECFENYVAVVLEDSGLTYLREAGIRGYYPQFRRSQRSVTDFLVHQGKSIILMDAKAIEPNDTVASTNDPELIQNRIAQNHIKGMTQAIKTIGHLREARYQHIPPIEDRFALIVTNQEFFVGTGEEFFLYLDENTQREIKDEAQDQLHLENIHFLTIDDLEAILGMSNEHGVEIADFFRFVRAQSKSPETNCLFMEQYIYRYLGDELGIGIVPSGSKALKAFSDSVWKRSEGIVTESSQALTVSDDLHQNIYSFLKRHSEQISWLKKLISQQDNH